MESSTRASGILFSIESPNIQSRSAQVAKLARVMREYLASIGRGVHMVKFPRHGHPYTWLIDRYERCIDGSRESVDPRLAALYYTAERLNVGMEIRRHLEVGDCVVVSGYTASTLVQEGAKIEGDDARFEFYRWLWDTEFRTFSIPCPEYHFIVLPNRFSGLWADKTYMLYDELPIMFAGHCERVESPVGRRDCMRGAHRKIWDQCRIILDIRLKKAT